MFSYLRGTLRGSQRAGFTLTEILVATALSLLLMLVAANGFGLIGESIGNNRAYIEISSRLRSAQVRLQQDLRYITVKPVPPIDPDTEQGYLEIIEGPGPWIELSPAKFFGQGIRPVKADGSFDSSVGDVDDVIMFTTRSHGEPFLGRSYTGNVQSQVAEVAWFVRGNTLYRRQLLVLPREGRRPVNVNHYNQSDVSVHLEGGQTDPRTAFASRAEELVANTLGDLTKRENRYAHQPLKFPHSAAFWWPYGLPTLQESTDPNWPLPELPASTAMGSLINFSGIPAAPTQVDFWNLPPSSGAFPEYDQGPRAGDDVILTNVIAFDVKVWDPEAPIFGQEIFDANGDVIAIEPVVPSDPLYKFRLADGATPLQRGAFVDLFYARGTGASIDTPFSGPGQGRSGLAVGASDENRQPAVFCTWSTHYENDGIDTDGDGTVDQGSDGLDQDGANGVDDPGEWETMPPYPAPLKAVQITIRVFDPDSGQVRQVTVVQDF